MTDTALAEILARLAAIEAALAAGTSNKAIVDRRVSRRPDDKSQLADDLGPRQPRRVRAGLTRGPPDDQLPLDPANDRRLTKRQVAEREACSTRTIDRRVADGSLPPPDIINNRCFWWLSALQRNERSRSQSTTHTPSNAGRGGPRSVPGRLAKASNTMTP